MLGGVATRTCSHNDTGHSSPELQDALACRNAHSPLDDTFVVGAGRGVDDLHPGLRGGVIGQSHPAGVGGRGQRRRTLMASMGYMTVCSWRACVSARRAAERAEAASTYSNAGKGAGGHVLGQGEVGRQGLIAVSTEGLMSVSLGGGEGVFRFSLARAAATYS